MKSRIAIWAATGALIAVFWAVYIAATMQNLKYPGSLGWVLIRLTCPIAVANHHPVSLYQVIAANTVTYGLIGAFLAFIRKHFQRRSIPT
jgi:hypothetical protein